MTAQEARALMPEIKGTDEIFNKIKISASGGLKYLWVRLDQSQIDELLKLGYSVLNHNEQELENRISW